MTLFLYILFATILIEAILNVVIIYNQKKLAKSQKEIEKLVAQWKENYKQTLPMN